MIIDWNNTAFFIKPGYTDMRKAINGLSVIVEEEMNKDPFSKALFFFRNRTGRIMKALYWERNGFCLWQKRLEKQKFPWPNTEEEAREISFDELKMLLSGIDFWKAHKELKYSTVS
jgi:transposase